MHRWFGLAFLASSMIALAAACAGTSSEVGSSEGNDGFGGNSPSGSGTSTNHGSGSGASTASGFPTPDGGPGCQPATCASLDVDCGEQSDGCGHMLDCGSCQTGEICGGGGPSKCGRGSCTPHTCAQLDASCGMQGDGCGNLIDCGTCTPPQTCGGGSVANACGGANCTPTSCAAQGYDCGPAADGCGGLVMCGTTCPTPGDFCGGGGPNKCGSNAVPCTPLTCADVGADCGPVSDGCGGLTPDCGACSGGNCCGCGGAANKCGGAPPPCVALKCSDLGPNACDHASDGCGGLTADCGGCTGGNCCGCGGAANVCGGAPVCTPLTCAAFPAGTCGQQSDGCGGLTLNCGSCTLPAYCGGGGPNKCGNTAQCVNLQCKQVTCSGGGTTSISGTVYDPAGRNPLPNVNVYVPNASVDPITTGATCNACDSGITGNPLVTTITDATGKFTLTNMPVDANVPVVIQIGKWRRQITVTTSRCSNVALTIAQVRLPKNKSEGDIPKIALSTGGWDSLECLLRKIGIDDAEFTNPSGSGRVNLYSGNPTTGTYYAKFEYDSGAQMPSSNTLWASQASLQKYDVTLLSCEGGTYTGSKTATNLKAMFDYVNGGGRVFASHYHYYWVAGNSNGTGTGKWSTLFNVAPTSYDIVTAGGSFSVNDTVVTAFPKGSSLANWLVTVGGSATAGSLTVVDGKHSLSAIDSSRVLEWIYASKAYDCTNANGSDTQCFAWDTTKPQRVTEYATFNAPVQNTPDAQCGRFVFSDIHVGSDDPQGSFPSACVSTSMDAQEKALEYMFFDLASAVCDQTQPPPTCTPITCADQGIECGPAPDGCGGTIANCGSCTAPLVCSTGGHCAGGSCTPKTCNDLGHDCGQWSDGCGKTLQCGTCTGNDTCGGAGTPGTCGSGSCTPATCTSLGYDCGTWSDGCGATLDCGSCTPPQTCGGGGMQGECGGNGCTPKTCQELGVACGPSGDGCGKTIDCGPCTMPMCTPLACGGRCGAQGDGCGAVITCPDCPPGSCVPTTCIKAGAQCGFFPNGCGKGLDCGNCPTGSTCVNNQCAGIH